MKEVYKFHQFVTLERGAVNTCISDFLKGEIYHLPNDIIDRFQNHCYEEIPEIVESLEEAELIIKVNENTRILPRFLGQQEEQKERRVLLELEEGVDIPQTLAYFDTGKIKIQMIHFFGDPKGKPFPQDIIIVPMKKDFTVCQTLCRVSGDFPHIDESMYFFNMLYHNCWGKKIAVTRDGIIHPCIYSYLSIGNIYAVTTFTDTETWEKAETFRRLSKEKIDKCQECEFKYVCFDCREIVFRATGDLYAANPFCSYDPVKGEWGELS